MLLCAFIRVVAKFFVFIFITLQLYLWYLCYIYYPVRACAKEIKQSFCVSVGTKITTLGNLGIWATR